MKTPRALVWRTRNRQRAEEEESLRRLWGVAECGGCGATIVLGEHTSGGHHGETCATCQALPSAVVAPAALRLESLGLHSISQAAARDLRDAA